jgi:hypothetical protein
MISRTLVHEIGHVIDWTVLQPFYTDINRNVRSIPFLYQFPSFQELWRERDKIFKGNPLYQGDSRNDQRKTNVGFVTNYSEQNEFEDFAEHFMHYIVNLKDFKDSAGKELTTFKNGILLKKYGFMKKMLENTKIDVTSASSSDAAVTPAPVSLPSSHTSSSAPSTSLPLSSISSSSNSSPYFLKEVDGGEFIEGDEIGTMLKYRLLRHE